MTRVQKLYPINDQNGQNQYPIDQNGWKTIAFGAAHTYIYVYSLYNGVPLGLLSSDQHTLAVHVCAN